MRTRGNKKKYFIIALIFLLVLAISVLGLLRRNQQQLDELDAFNQQVYTDWFGSTHPDLIEMMLIWEDEGLAGVFGMDDEKINGIRNGINLPSTLPEAEQERILADVDLILTGGFPILDEASFEAERFISAINRVDSSIGGSSVFGRWRVALYGGE